MGDRCELTRCMSCHHMVMKKEVTYVTFTELIPNTIRIKQTRFRLCYKCAGIPRMLWEERRDSFKQGVTKEEQNALIGGLWK